MSAVWLWLICLAALPASISVATLLGLEVERLRRMTTVCAATMVIACGLIFFVPDLHAFEILPAPGLGEFWGKSILRLDPFSSALIPLPAALWLLTVAVTPRTRLDRAGLPRTAIATLITTIAFLTVSPPLLLLLWILSVLLYLAALAAPEYRSARRVAVTYLGVATALFALGLLLVTGRVGRDGNLEHVGLGLIIVASLIRKGIFPFHAWLPHAFDRGQIGPAILFSAPQMGAYVTAVLITPYASLEALRWVAILALFTAVYAAALALFQTDARRACGYLFVSQSALVMTGLECTSRQALAGSLTLWISSALAFAGIARCVLVLEARRGRLDLSRHHGGFEQMPLLAASFLVLALACTGFPGTLGFVAAELLVDGAVEVFPVLGFSVVLAGALTGLAVLRMYFSLFCGRRDLGVHLGLLRREAIAFAAVATFLVLNGLAPGPMVASRLGASELLFRLRAERRPPDDVSTFYDRRGKARHQLSAPDLRVHTSRSWVHPERERQPVDGDDPAAARGDAPGPRVRGGMSHARTTRPRPRVDGLRATSPARVSARDRVGTGLASQSCSRCGCSKVDRIEERPISGQGEHVMKVEQLMTKKVVSCRGDETLSDAARVMWEHDCGFVPIVESADNARVVGVVTDRDVCMATYTRGLAPSEVWIRDVMSTGVRQCKPSDTLAAAEEAMREAQIHRLPVVDEAGQLLGVISLADIARQAAREAGAKRRAVSAAEIGETLAAIRKPREIAAGSA